MCMKMLGFTRLEGISRREEMRFLCVNFCPLGDNYILTGASLFGLIKLIAMDCNVSGYP